MPLQLVIVRHGKSLYDDYVGMDMQRHLAPRGYADAYDSLKWCLHREVVPDLIVSSPAIRAFSTALIFANGYAYPPGDIRLVGAIYEATISQLLYVMAALPPQAKTAFLFGHNPGCTDLVNYLCGPVMTHLPTAGVAVVELTIHRWTEVSVGSGQLVEAWSGHKRIE